MTHLTLSKKDGLIDLLDQEETEVRQCSHTRLNLGVANTAFFTKNTRERKLKNTLLGNIDMNGSPITTRHELCEATITHLET